MIGRVFALCLTGLLLAACDAGVPGIAKLPADGVVLAFGDSLTYGYGARPEESYPAVLQALIERRVIRSGAPGEVTSGGLARLPGVLRKHRPNLLIMIHGGNDILRGVAPKNIEANLRAMVRMAKDEGIDVVLIGVPRAGIFLGQSAGLYEKIAEEFAIPYDGKILPGILVKSSLKSDGIHPNAQGYRKLAKGIEALLKKSGAI